MYLLIGSSGRRSSAEGNDGRRRNSVAVLLVGRCRSSVVGTVDAAVLW